MTLQFVKSAEIKDERRESERERGREREREKERRGRENRRKGISVERGRGCVRVKTQGKNAKQRVRTVKTREG